jgi:hypothetical protein
LLIAQPKQIPAHLSSRNTNQYRIVRLQKLMSSDPSAAVVLILSNNVICSNCVRAEIIMVAKRKLPLYAIRIEQVEPEGPLELHLAGSPGSPPYRRRWVFRGKAMRNSGL